MMSSKKVALGIVGVALLIGSQVYGDWSARGAAETRVKELELQLQSVRSEEAARIAELAMELDLVQSRLAETASDTTANVQKTAASVRREQEKAVALLQQSLSEQATAMNSIREESGTRLNELRTEASTNFEAVHGAVTKVTGDVDVVREDVAQSRRALDDVRDSLGRQIAHNADELAVLKRQGEREYVEFDMRKAKDLQRIAGIRMQLNKADVKAKRYDLTLQVDDDKLQKKGQLVNEPVQLLVGKDRLRYEIVVNFIDKDRIRGYISTPKVTPASASALKD